MESDYIINFERINQLIRTNGGSEMWCSKISFYSEEEYREEKLNKILEDDSNI